MVNEAFELQFGFAATSAWVTILLSFISWRLSAVPDLLRRSRQVDDLYIRGLGWPEIVSERALTIAAQLGMLAAFTVFVVAFYHYVRYYELVTHAARRDFYHDPGFVTRIAQASSLERAVVVWMSITGIAATLLSWICILFTRGVPKLDSGIIRLGHPTAWPTTEADTFLILWMRRIKEVVVLSESGARREHLRRCESERCWERSWKEWHVISIEYADAFDSVRVSVGGPVGE